MLKLLVWIIVILRHSASSEHFLETVHVRGGDDPCQGVEMNAEGKKKNKVLVHLLPSDPI